MIIRGEQLLGFGGDIGAVLRMGDNVEFTGFDCAHRPIGNRFRAQTSGDAIPKVVAGLRLQERLFSAPESIWTLESVLIQTRPHEPRTEDADADAGPHEFRGQRFTDRDGRGLGRAIWRGARQAPKSRHRCGIDDMPLLAVSAHVRHERRDAVDDAHHVDGERPTPIVGTFSLERARCQHARIVAENVQSAERAQGVPGCGVHRFGLRYVAFHGGELPRESELIRGAPQRCSFDIREHDLHSLAKQSVRQREAKPACGPSDESGLSFKVLHLTLPRTKLMGTRPMRAAILYYIMRFSQTNSTSSSDIARDTEAAVRRRLTWILSLSMLVAMMDRNNVNLAALKMNEALGLTATQLGSGLSAFYVAYLVATIPSNVLLNRFGARRWIARIMISWGIVCAASAFVWNPISFYSVRFALGLAEAGFLPGVLLYLTRWVPEGGRGRMNSYFLTAIPISGVVTAVVSGFILKFDGIMGFSGWQLIFVLEAAPAIVLGLIVLLYLDDRPENAAWLSSTQKSWLARTLEEEERRSEAHRAPTSALQTLRILLGRPAFNALLLAYFLFNFALAALVWIPQILQAFALSPFENSLLTAVPAAGAVVIMIGTARSSDRLRERRWHFLATTCLCTVGYLLAAYPSHSLIVAICGLVLASGGAFAGLAVFWTLPPMFLRESERPVGMGLVTTIGVIAGMLSPLIMGRLRDLMGTYSIALLIGAILPLLGGLVVVGLNAHAAGEPGSQFPGDTHVPNH
jgi:ACS family tartrate transporter-like MFS transporter